MKKFKTVFVNTYIVVFIAVSMLSPVSASSTSEKIHRHYIAKTLQMSSGEHTVKGGVIDGVVIYVQQINNADDGTSDYKNIRVNLYAGNGTSTAWLCNNQGAILSGKGTRECNAKLGLKTYYEFYTGSTTNNNIVIRYYGNSENVAAYAYLKEIVNDSN